MMLPFAAGRPITDVSWDAVAAINRDHAAERDGVTKEAALALLAAVAGLLLDGVYGEAGSTAEMLRGYDLVTLVFVVPALASSQLQARRGSDRAQLIWVGMLAYLVYTYAYYLLGAPFEDLFLLQERTRNAAGVKAHHANYPTLLHDFYIMGDVSPAVIEAAREAGAAIKAAL